MATTQDDAGQAYWDQHARRDPLWAILSDPSRAGRRWTLPEFLETGRREISLLMYQLRALGIDVDPSAALDFGCGVGRLSQPLATYFQRVTGVDVAPEMIRLANEINDHQDRVRYLHNPTTRLAALSDGEFSFIYSNVVLQHIDPACTLEYLREFFRVAASGAVLVFQLPSHPRPPEEQQQHVTRPMQDDAYRASILLQNDVPAAAAVGDEFELVLSVRNDSPHPWSQHQAGAIRVGNHWLSSSGAMLVQDDGRASLPMDLAAGATCQVSLTVKVPAEPGSYQLQCDVVHEGVTWFADRGSETWSQPVRASGTPSASVRDAGVAAVGASADSTDRTLSLPDEASAPEPGPLPMHAVHRDVIEQLIGEHGGTLLHVENDERCGREWIGYRYFISLGVSLRQTPTDRRQGGRQAWFPP